MKKIYAICMLLVLNQGIQAQWSAVGTGVNSSCDVLNVYNGQLIAAGRYSSLTTWNGSEWSDFEGGPSATSILVEGEDMYTGGQFTGGESAKVIRHFDGNTWSTLGGGVGAYDIVYWNTNYKWTSIFKYNNRIYGNYNAKLVRFDNDLQEMVTVGNILEDLGEQPAFLLYAGTVNNITYHRSMINNVERVVTWDDTEYDTLNLSNYPLRGIYSMTVWNGELYISGGFQNLQGEIFSILKWDGNVVIPVLNYNIDVPLINLNTSNSYLYGLYYADGFGRIGIWTGSNFEDIAVDAGADAMADLNGTIYVGGFFTSFTGIPVNNIAQREYALSTSQISEIPTFFIAPNPSTNGFTETTPSPLSRHVSIYSVTGQVIKTQILQAGETKISVENLRTGLYIVQMSSGNEMAVARLVVQ